MKQENNLGEVVSKLKPKTKPVWITWLLGFGWGALFSTLMWSFVYKETKDILDQMRIDLEYSRYIRFFVEPLERPSVPPPIFVET
ncbi:MAG: hypothetical protein WC087_01880 [Candidatus Paceibacterota bacterium]